MYGTAKNNSQKSEQGCLRFSSKFLYMIAPSWLHPAALRGGTLFDMGGGAEHMVLMSGDGRVYACGCNAAGQLGLSYDGAGQLGGEASAGE